VNIENYGTRNKLFISNAQAIKLSRIDETVYSQISEMFVAMCDKLCTKDKKGTIKKVFFWKTNAVTVILVLLW
jgi:hypothetical protein